MDKFTTQGLDGEVHSEKGKKKKKRMRVRTELRILGPGISRKERRGVTTPDPRFRQEPFETVFRSFFLSLKLVPTKKTCSSTTIIISFYYPVIVFIS